LIAAADTKLGDATRSANQGAGLNKDFADADYLYDSASGTTKMADALAKYLIWQKILLMEQAYDITCWKKDAVAPSGDFADSGDTFEKCAKGAWASGTRDYYPLT